MPVISILTLSILTSIPVAYWSDGNITPESISPIDAAEVSVRFADSCVALPGAWIWLGFDSLCLKSVIDSQELVRYPAEVSEFKPWVLGDLRLRAVPLGYDYYSLNYDPNYFAGQELPQSWEDLARPEFAHLLALPNPMQGGAGLAFLAISVERLGEVGARRFWAQLRDGGARITRDWEEAYFSAYSGHGGPYPLMFGYASTAQIERDLAPAVAAPSQILDLPGASLRTVRYLAVSNRADNTAFVAAEQIRSLYLEQPWFGSPLAGSGTAPFPSPKEPARIREREISQSQEVWLADFRKIFYLGQNLD